MSETNEFLPKRVTIYRLETESYEFECGLRDWIQRESRSYDDGLSSIYFRSKERAQEFTHLILDEIGKSRKQSHHVNIPFELLSEEDRKSFMDKELMKQIVSRYSEEYKISPNNDWGMTLSREIESKIVFYRKTEKTVVVDDQEYKREDFSKHETSWYKTGYVQHCYVGFAEESMIEIS